MKKIIIAADSFKGNMRAPEVCETINNGLKEGDSNIETILIPMADGGEGTVDSIVAVTNAEIKTATVTGPLGDSVQAEYAITADKKTAILEMASASGIELIDKKDLNPLKATTYGTGELIKHILETHAVEEIIIGIGGSATVDGGSGMAIALGYELLNASGKSISLGGGELSSITKINTANAHPKIKEIKFRIASDVTNPLLGEKGAAKIFGPQKGATPEMVEILEAGLSNLNSICKNQKLLTEDVEGDGAAGGLGAGLRAFCNAESESGAELLIEVSNMRDELKNADLVITGEGCTDGQTIDGKLCSVIAKTAREYNVPTIILSGALKGDIKQLHKLFSAAFSISSGHNSLEASIKASKEDLFFTAKNLSRII